MIRNTNPFAPWNDPCSRHDPFAPHNDPIRRDSPWEPWNQPFGDEKDLSCEDRKKYDRRFHCKCDDEMEDK